MSENQTSYAISRSSTSESLTERDAQPLLRGENLFCERDDRVLFSGLDFSVSPSEVLQIKGSNGSGKTTLLRILCGLNDNYTGGLYWRGQPLEEQLTDFHASLAYIGHRVGVNKVLTPIENLRWSSSMQSGADDATIMAALKSVGLRGFEESQCFTLSAGQQQRVSLARLLVLRAKLWILDEPFTTLDVHAVSYLESLLDSHAKSGGSVIVTTHHQIQVDKLNILDLK